MKKRMLSMLLAIIMVMSLLPISVVTADEWIQPNLYVAGVTAIFNGELRNANPIAGASVSYDAANRIATLTLNGVNTDDFLTSRGGSIVTYDLSHLYIVLADGSENNFKVSWYGADFLSFIYATCPVTISGNGTINATLNNISGGFYGYNLTYTYGIRCVSGTLTVCDGASVNIAVDADSDKCNGIQASNVLLRDADLSVNIFNDDVATTTACLNGTVSLVSGSLSMKTNRGDIGGTVNSQGATVSTAGGTTTYTMTPHTWTYVASGNTIRVWCSNADHNCAYFGEKNACALTITAADTTYEKEDITKTLSMEIMGGIYEYTSTDSVSVQHPGATLDNGVSDIVSRNAVSVTYTGTGDTNYNSTTPPINAGTYAANVTLGGCTATDHFTIAKAALAYTAPTAKSDLTYQDAAQQLINPGAVTTQWYLINQPSPCGRMEYRLGASGDWSTEIPVAQDAGTYQVYWRVVPVEDYAANYASFEAGEPLTVSISGSNMDGVSASGYENVYDGRQHSITVNAPEGATITYQGPDAKEYSESNPSFTAVGEYSVAYKVEKAGYNTVTGTEIVKIAPKTLTVTADDQKMAVCKELPLFTYTITGFVDGETEDVLISQPVADVATDGKAAGTYEITVFGAEADNYVFTYVSGELFVCGHSNDYNGDGKLDNNDVVALLWFILYPEFNTDNQCVDVDHNGTSNNNDVVALLWHILFPEEYPL